MPRTIISKLQENPDYLRKPGRKSTKKKKIRYKKIAFKLTAAQEDALRKVCRRQKTTPVRFLKSVVKKQTMGYIKTPQPANYVSENQLQLFDNDDL